MDFLSNNFDMKNVEGLESELDEQLIDDVNNQKVKKIMTQINAKLSKLPPEERKKYLKSLRNIINHAIIKKKKNLFKDNDSIDSEQAYMSEYDISSLIPLEEEEKDMMDLDMSEYDTSGRCTSLRHSYLEKETAVWVAKMCMEHGLMHSVFIEGKGYSEPHFHKMILDMFMGTQYEDYVKASRSSSEDIVAQIEDTASGVENIWIRCSSRYERDMIDRSIRKHFPVNTVLTADTDVEVGNICASKGLALKELALSLGIRKNQVIAIGDNENDLDMLNESGIPVAMGNATDNVKAIASLITYSNEEDGAAEAIEQVIAACLKEKQAAFS